MSQTVEIRDYLPSDGVVCYDLRHSAFLSVFSESLPQKAAQVGADSYDVVEFAERISAMEPYVATVRNSVVGFCTIRVDSPIRVEVLYLYIDSQHRGAGVGSRLVHHAEQRVISSLPKIETIYLDTIYLDTIVPGYNQRFWELMGYCYVGQSTCNYPGSKIPAIRLEKSYQTVV